MIFRDEGSDGGVSTGGPPAGAAAAPISAAPSSAAAPASAGSQPASGLSGSPVRTVPDPAPLSARVRKAGRDKLAAQTADPAAASGPTQPSGATPPAPGTTAAVQAALNPDGSPVPTAPTAPAGQAQPTLVDVVHQMTGIDFRGKFANEAEYLKRSAHAMQLVGQRDMDAEYGRQFRQYEQQFREYLNGGPAAGAMTSGQQAQPGQQAPAAPEPRDVWQVPQYNPAWQQFIQTTTDPTTGEVSTQIRPDTPHGIRQQIEDFRQSKLEFEHSWQSNPGQMVDQRFEKLFTDRMAQFEEKMAAEFTQRENHYQAAQIVQQNNAWMWEQGPDGQPRRDPYTNQAIPTRRGQFYLQAVQRFGPVAANPAELHELALQFANGQAAQEILALPQINAFLTGQPLAPQQQNILGQPGLPGPSVPAVTVAPQRTPPGARHLPNQTAGASPGQPAPYQLPNVPLRERIKQMARAQAGVGV